MMACHKGYLSRQMERPGNRQGMTKIAIQVVHTLCRAIKKESYPRAFKLGWIGTRKTAPTFIKATTWLPSWWWSGRGWYNRRHNLHDKQFARLLSFGEREDLLGKENHEEIVMKIDESGVHKPKMTMPEGYFEPCSYWSAAATRTTPRGCPIRCKTSQEERSQDWS
jgi:hypothetical protein